MLANFMIFQHIFLPKSDPMHFGLSGPMHLQRGRLFRAPTARRSVAPRTVELLWALNGRPGGSVGEKEVLTVRHGQRLTFLWGFGLSNQLGAAREIFLVSAPNTHMGAKLRISAQILVCWENSLKRQRIWYRLTSRNAEEKIGVSRPSRVSVGVIPGSWCQVTLHHCVTHQCTQSAQTIALRGAFLC